MEFVPDLGRTGGNEFFETADLSFAGAEELLWVEPEVAVGGPDGVGEPCFDGRQALAGGEKAGRVEGDVWHTQREGMMDGG